MRESSGSFQRTSTRLAAILAAVLAAGLIGAAATAQDAAVGPVTGVPGITLASVECYHDNQAIMGDLHSEYLREMAQDWGPICCDATLRFELDVVAGELPMGLITDL